MKLNTEYVRDVLLSVEKLHDLVPDGYGNLSSLIVTDTDIGEDLPDIPQKDICYTLLKLDEAGFITLSLDEGDDAIQICATSGLTYDGHVFLESIRDKEQWNKVRKIAKELKNFSVPVLTEIAQTLITKTIAEMLG